MHFLLLSFVPKNLLFSYEFSGNPLVITRVVHTSFVRSLHSFHSSTTYTIEIPPEAGISTFSVFHLQTSAMITRAYRPGANIGDGYDSLQGDSKARAFTAVPNDTELQVLQIFFSYLL